MKTLKAVFNYIDCIGLTRIDVNTCYHSGECIEDVRSVVSKPYVQRQLKSLNPESIVKELREYGVWEDGELQDLQTNYERIVWAAAGNIFEEL